MEAPASVSVVDHGGKEAETPPTPPGGPSLCGTVSGGVESGEAGTPPAGCVVSVVESASVASSKRTVDSGGNELVQSVAKFIHMMADRLAQCLPATLPHFSGEGNLVGEESFDRWVEQRELWWQDMDRR